MALEKAVDRANKLLYSRDIGKVAPARIEELRAAVNSKDRNRITQACNMVDTAFFLLRTLEKLDD